MKTWVSASMALMALAGLALAAEPPPDARRSGFDFMGASTQAMQRDDALNPGMLWVLEGEAAWSQPVGAEGRSCAGCHGAARQSMRGVAARYPAFDAALQRPIDLRQRIAGCRQKLYPQVIAAGDTPQALALEAYVAFQSRGLPIAPPDDPRLEPARERGRQLFHQRLGQLGLACSDCHDAQAGRRLGGSPIPQAHPTGYPIYRLEWQGLGSLQRRLRACLSGVRAEPFAWGAPEWIDLELFLASRARGMPLESPGVRP
jgi:sulfur-oxidizing protein SoxA